jgi:hypothetical protein
MLSWTSGESTAPRATSESLLGMGYPSCCMQWETFQTQACPQQDIRWLTSTRPSNENMWTGKSWWGSRDWETDCAKRAESSSTDRQCAHFGAQCGGLATRHGRTTGARITRRGGQLGECRQHQCQQQTSCCLGHGGLPVLYVHCRVVRCTQCLGVPAASSTRQKVRLGRVRAYSGASVRASRAG